MKKIYCLVILLLFPLTVFATDYDLGNVNKMSEAVTAYVGKRISVGDINNDGYDDLFINSLDKLYVTYGSNSLSGSIDLSNPDVHIISSLIDLSENSVSTAGDINGDSYDDLIIGSPLGGGGVPDTGAVNIIYGSASLNSNYSELYNDADVSYPSITTGDYTGWAVSSAGDYNGDGYDDILVGAYANDTYGTNTGLVYLIYGSASLSSANINVAASATFFGESDNDGAGYAVASAGDVNNDGFDDMLISAHSHDGGGHDNSGAAYIIYGQAAQYSGNFHLSTADLKFIGENTNDGASLNIASAGDVNNDGYDDVLIDAGGDDTGGNAAGAAYLVYGSNTLVSPIDLSSADAKFIGENAADFAGSGLSSAGDVNNDGYSDIMVGAYGESTGGNAAGAAYLIFGSNSLSGSLDLSSADLKFIGEDAGDYAGFAVSAGDFNGDNFSDFVAGAFRADATNGAAYYDYIYIDADIDGVAGDTGILSGTDCNDADATVYANQTYYQDADGDTLGNPNITTSVCSLTPPDGYVANDDDPDDTIPSNDEENPIVSVVGAKNGKIKVYYANDTMYKYTIFNNLDTDKKTKVKQYRETAYYIVLQPQGKKVALVNIFNGEVLKRKTINKNTKYKYNALKVYEFRDKYFATAISKKKDNLVRLVIVRIKINKEKFGDLDQELIDSLKIKPSKTKKKDNTIKLRNKTGDVKAKYLVTKKYHLKVK